VTTAGQGVHYAKAWAKLKNMASYWKPGAIRCRQKRLPEDHPLELGSVARRSGDGVQFHARRRCRVRHRRQPDRTGFATRVPAARRSFTATLDPNDINKDYRRPTVWSAMPTGARGDAMRRREDRPAPRGRLAAGRRNREVRQGWLNKWMPKRHHVGAAESPIVCCGTLAHTVDVANTIITHDRAPARSAVAVLALDRAA